MDLGIAGRWAIVCASSQGLGLACARALAAEGVNVVINGRDAERLAKAASELDVDSTAEVHAVAAGITTGDGRARLLAACPDPDILVTNNAGPRPGAALRPDREHHRGDGHHAARQVLAEWDPHPFGVIHEHVPVAAVKRIPVPITWILGGEGSWMAGLQERVSRARPGIKTVVVPGASHLVHRDRPDEFIAAVRAAAGLER